MAEGIKISEMEQVTTLKEGCCFPVISDGTNKRITQKDLYSLMTSDLQKQITDDKNDLQNQITNNDTDITNLQNQITSNDNDITNLQNQVTSNDTNITNLKNQVTDLQSQITNISKPNNIEIFRYAINESTENWIVGNADKYKVINLPESARPINSCFTNGGIAEFATFVDENGTTIKGIRIRVNSTASSCKGYFEYMK